MEYPFIAIAPRFTLTQSGKAELAGAVEYINGNAAKQ